MKIATLSKVKNEADIIESFVRYHGQIADRMYFVENGSTDNTLEILCELRQEGYAITIFDERDSEFDELMFINKYARLILQQQRFDWLVPIDADEFLYAEGQNPRLYLEQWHTDTVYLVNWRTYIYTAKEEAQNKFVPECFVDYRHEKYETFTKVIVPGQLYRGGGLLISRGNHDVVGTEVKKQQIKEIKFAHYPIRSQEQFQTQIVINSIMQSSRFDYQKEEAWHWGQMYRSIKEQREVDLQEVSLTYAIPQEQRQMYGTMKVCRGKLRYEFLGTIQLKYSSLARISAFYNLMCAGETLAGRLCAREGAGPVETEDISRKKIVIYGVGRIAQGYVNAINTKQYEIMAYVDSNVEKETFFCGKLIQDKQVLMQHMYDYIVVTSSIYFQEIKSDLLRLGVAEDKICFIADIIKNGWDQTYRCL